MAQRPEAEGPDASGNWRNRLFNSPAAEGTKIEDVQTKPQTTRSGAANPPPRALPDGQIAAIGETLTIKGDVAAREDLVIRGAIQGNVVVNDHHVQIGESGRLDGNIIAKHITIRGQAKGDIQGLEKVTILATGKLEGTISANRVVLEEGGWFKGMIDMPPREQERQAEAPTLAKQQDKGVERKMTAAAAPPKTAKS